MVIIDKDTKQAHTLLNLNDVLDYVGNKCGDDIKQYLEEHIDTLNDEIRGLNETIDSMQEELNIYTEDEE